MIVSHYKIIRDNGKVKLPIVMLVPIGTAKNNKILYFVPTNCKGVEGLFRFTCPN